MNILAVLLALAMVGLAAIMRWYLTRRWRLFLISPKELELPRMCPICLSTNVTETVHEKSSERQTANYIVARKIEWWNFKVPHCSMCAKKLFNGELIGLALGTACVVAAILVFPPDELGWVVLCYILYGLPVYVAVTMPRKGIVFGRADNKYISARIRHPEYFQALVAATHSVPPPKRVIAL